jgi:hypothetical protein
MLLESDVISAVTERLSRHGYRIVQALSTTERGDDIIAERLDVNLRRLVIEAKGESSSRRNSARFGMPFDSAQVSIHVAEALYKAAEIISRRSSGGELCVGIALPDNVSHRAAVRKVIPVLRKLEIALFWVGQEGEIEIDASWKL